MEGETREQDNRPKRKDEWRGEMLRRRDLLNDVITTILSN
jgi:hypothetical protein